MSTTRAVFLRVVAVTLAVLGVVCLTAGAVTWSVVTRSLAAEQITVAQDAPALVGNRVDTPWEAWAQAQAIGREQAAATGGATYAQLANDDPKRRTVLDATLLRAALYSAVTAFGLAALALAGGLVLLLLSAALVVLAAPARASATHG
jgi:hypothetical protein